MASNNPVPAAKWLTRRQVALLLGMPENEVQQLDGKILHPTQRSDRSWQYDPEEVRGALARAERPASDTGRLDGEATATTFALFE
jgi:hypothetical protein